MAKEKRSASDLDAELAALEAELAALEGRKKAPKEPKRAKEPKPQKAEPEPPAQADAAPAPEKKGRFSLPKFGKKATPEPGAPEAGDARVAPAPEPAPAPPALLHPEGPAAPLAAPSRAESTPPAPKPAEVAAQYDLSLWRQEGEAWVRVVPETPVPSVRRILDEDGNVVREEPMGAREIESSSAVKAERGLGRLLRRK